MRVGSQQPQPAQKAQIHGCCAGLRRTAERVAVCAYETWDMSGTWGERFMYGLLHIFRPDNAADRAFELHRLLRFEGRPMLKKNIEWLKGRYK